MPPTQRPQGEGVESNRAIGEYAFRVVSLRNEDCSANNLAGLEVQQRLIRLVQLPTGHLDRFELAALCERNELSEFRQATHIGTAHTHGPQRKVDEGLLQFATVEANHNGLAAFSEAG